MRVTYKPNSHTALHRSASDLNPKFGKKWVKLDILQSVKKDAPPKPANDDVLEVKESVAPPSYDLPVVFNDSIHKPHLENFFNAIRGNETLNCPGEVGLEALVSVLKINDAIQSGQKIVFNANDFKA